MSPSRALSSPTDGFHGRLSIELYGMKALGAADKPLARQAAAFPAFAAAERRAAGSRA